MNDWGPSYKNERTVDGRKVGGMVGRKKDVIWFKKYFGLVHLKIYVFLIVFIASCIFLLFICSFGICLFRQ